MSRSRRRAQQQDTKRMSSVQQQHESIMGTSSSNYERIPSAATEQPGASSTPTISTPNLVASRRVLWNFIAMSILFSANHGCVVSCLGLATARLGSIGAWQSGTLYIAYTLSALLGATYITKTLHGLYTMMLGMSLYCIYVSCFWYASRDTSSNDSMFVILGALFGGLGAGLIWTGQGAYFTESSMRHAGLLQQEVEHSTSTFAGVFAFIYLLEEVLLRLLSTLLLQFTGLSWETIFGMYAFVAISSTVGMLWIQNYTSSDNSNDNNIHIFYKITAALQLLLRDPKMKHMIGLNAVFGFCGAFVNSYINGQVVRVALSDNSSRYVGALTAWLAAVAAIMSLVLARVSQIHGKGPVLIAGALCFFFVALLFIVFPDVQQQWGWGKLLLVYALQGTGRATFESTLKATFADYFSYEKEGAFANIILQNGLSSAIGYVLTFRLQCDNRSKYCVEYHDGTLHNVLLFELLVIITAVFAIFGYWRASAIHEQEQNANKEDVELLENAAGIT